MSNTKKEKVTTIEYLRKIGIVDTQEKNVYYGNFHIKLDIFELFKFITQSTNVLYFENCDFEIFKLSGYVEDVKDDVVKKIIFDSCNFVNKFNFSLDAKNIINLKVYLLFDKCIFADGFKVGNISNIWVEIKESVDTININIFRAKSVDLYTTDCTVNEITICNVYNNLSLNELTNLDIDEMNPQSITRINQVNNFGLVEKFNIINSTVSSTFYLDNLCDYDFRNVTFENELIAIQPNINDKKSHKINAVNCTFNGTVTLSESLWSDLCFKDSDFNKLVIEEAHAVNMEFTNCKFLKTSKIYNLVNPIQSANFALSTIKGIFLFNGWNRKRLKFAPDAHINFSHIFLEPSGYLIIRDVNKEENLFGNFNFACANLLGSVVFTDVYAKSLDLTCATIVGTFNEENTSFAQNSNSNTYTKLKNEAIKKSSTSGFIEYRAAAMTARLKELKKDKKAKSRYTNIWLLRFNKWSNKNGISWVRGVLFTMGVTFFFFILITALGTTNKFVWGWHGWDAFGLLVQQYLAVLNIVDLSGEPSILNLNSGGEVIFFISKIFVGYGIYQTIAAFRKYGK